MSRNIIKPGETLTIQTDARKWKLRNDWLPGRYRLNVRVDHLQADAFCTLSVLSDSIPFEIQ